MKTLPSILLSLLSIVVIGGSSTFCQSDGAKGTTQPELLRGGAFRYGGQAHAQPALPPALHSRLQQQRSFGPLALGVRRRVPQDYATIQAAINASADGDTVLVSEGTYKENIRYHGKAIVVGSLYVVNGDTTHIAKTIIDGSGLTQADSGSVVYFVNNEDTTSVLCGLTITGGTGTRLYIPDYGWYRIGGGIYCRYSGARITSNVITRNRIVAEEGAAGVGGGVGAMGLSSPLPDVILEGNRIEDNYVRGISGTGSAGGAAFSGVNVRVVGNVFERDSVVGNLGAVGGAMVMDWYSVELPPFHAYIKGNVFRSNIVNTTSEFAIAAGIEVWGAADATISENLFEANIGTSVNGWAQGGGLFVSDRYASGCGRKMIVKNQFLNNRLTFGGGEPLCGAGVMLWYTTATLNANEIARNNANGMGAGVCVDHSSFRLENNIVTGNVTTTRGGGLYVRGNLSAGAEQAIVNNTITANRATLFGGGVMVSSGNVVALNNILWADTAQTGSEIYGAVTAVRYSDVQGGYSGEGNIDVDPSFLADTHVLGDASQCIGAGRDSMQIGGVWYRVPPQCFYGGPRPNPVGSYPDIGACENPLPTPTGVDEQWSQLPSRCELEQNYPNPFNPSTTIKYKLPKSTIVRLSVYDMLGREVSVLVNERRDAGVHDVRFDGSNLASGVYFYHLQAGDFVQAKRLVILK